jgi:hypothetical protein
VAFYVDMEQIILKTCTYEKKIIFFALMVFIMSCDKVGYNNFTIVNNCNDEIAVSVIFFNDSIMEFVVMAKTEYLFHESGGGIPAKSSTLVEHAFKQIVITKNGKVSQKNYVDKA